MMQAIIFYFLLEDTERESGLKNGDFCYYFLLITSTIQPISTNSTISVSLL